MLPESEKEPDVLWLRPLGGSDDEVAGVYLPLETVEPAQFRSPDPERELGTHRSLALLRDALRLGPSRAWRSTSRATRRAEAPRSSATGC